MHHSSSSPREQSHRSGRLAWTVVPRLLSGSEPTPALDQAGTRGNPTGGKNARAHYRRLPDFKEFRNAQKLFPPIMRRESVRSFALPCIPYEKGRVRKGWLGHPQRSLLQTRMRSLRGFSSRAQEAYQISCAGSNCETTAARIAGTFFAFGSDPGDNLAMCDVDRLQHGYRIEIRRRKGECKWRRGCSVF